MFSVTLRSLILTTLLLLTACSGATRSAAEQKYYGDLNTAYRQLKTVDSLVNSNSFAQARYSSAVTQMLPPTQEVLRQYRDSEYAGRESYKAVFHAYENFVLAQSLWEQNKGLSLVNKRLAEGSEWLGQAQRLMQQEQKGS